MGGHAPRRGPVVLVDVDGLDPSYLDRHADRLPELHRLAEEGVRTVAAGTYKSVSNPNRAGIATGAPPRVHRNTAYVLDPRTGRARGQNRRLEAETLFEAARRQGRTLLSAGWYIVQRRGADPGDPAALYTQGADWEANAGAVAAALRGEDVQGALGPVQLPRVPDLIAAYTAHIDTISHAAGPDAAELPRALERLDAGLGLITAAVRDSGLAGAAVLAVVSDHGATGWDRSLEPEVFGAIRAAGFRVERVASGRRPSRRTQVAVTASPRAANLYLRGAAARPAGRTRLAGVLNRLCGGPAPVLERVFDRAALAALGAAPEEGDFAVDARPPYAFAPPGDVPAVPRGGHATMREAAAPVVLSGRPVVPGARPAAPRTLDIAPTLAHLLGIAPPAQSEGRAWTEALRPH
ncbi:alkaline phosphatase family protein [Nocardiopsis coralliicola]